MKSSSEIADNIEKKSLPMLWHKEFIKGGIPSSVRSKPSAAVERLPVILKIEESLLKGRKLHGVDLGCGTGRNTAYMAKFSNMLAVDFVPENIAIINEWAEESKISENVKGMVVDLTGAWGIPETKYDFFIDTYCFKHIIDLAARLNYKSELTKYATEGTIYLLTLASTEDGYYSTCNKLPSSEVGVQIIVDPGNKIPSILYTPEKIIEFFSPEFKLLDMQINEQKNSMHGKDYLRKGFEFTFCRN